ncbi:class D beta-lactamase [Fulvivirgaceae bacterium BMA12]|uniref:Beta-lactamase n=1 Tax=Agaribacillus aureus TaxID=3051825 RepID=A0ABT8L865_9BACT|nr:class D beta-lactamase [Fulvivirgaceae bacterium BMA12]
MKHYFFFTILIILSSCADNKNAHIADQPETIKEKQITKPEFQAIIDSAQVEGSVLIYDFQEDVHYSNNFQWANKGNLPASTFKIVNSIIALETGVVKDDSTLFKWDGKKRRMKAWEQDLIFRDAFHASCVPCYQEVARSIGEKRMNEYLTKLDYGNMQVDSSNIDNFWLEGNSHINQFQQIDFLKRFYKSELPISKRTEKIMKRLMVIEDNERYRLIGKTGWSIRNGNNNGWFVGYVEKKQEVYFFATNVEPQEQFNMELFSMIRKEVTGKALKQIGIIK